MPNKTKTKRVKVRNKLVRTSVFGVQPDLIKNATFVGEKVWLNEKEQKLYLWLKREVKYVEIFTEDNRYYGITLNPLP